MGVTGMSHVDHQSYAQPQLSVLFVNQNRNHKVFSSSRSLAAPLRKECGALPPLKAASKSTHTNTHTHARTQSCTTKVITEYLLHERGPRIKKRSYTSSRTRCEEAHPVAGHDVCVSK